MKKKTFSFIFPVILLSVILIACNGNQQSSSNTNEPNANNPGTANNDQLTQERLRRFDSLDFQFYSNQQWDSFAVSHDPNIKVYYPDGTVTTGLFPQHINMLTP